MSARIVSTNIVPVLLNKILFFFVYFVTVVQNIRDSYLLSALHSYSDTLSVKNFLRRFVLRNLHNFDFVVLQVHSMNISLVPLDIYKIPKHCSDVLVAQNFLYTVQHIVSHVNDTQTIDNSLAESVFSHAVGVVSGSFSNVNICEEAVSSFAPCQQFAIFLLTFPKNRNSTNHRTSDTST